MDRNGQPPRMQSQYSGHDLRRAPNMIYDVGWICALHEELAAARAMFDVDLGNVFGKGEGDDNVYATGKIHDLNVVVACLPAGIHGSTPATRVAMNMLQTFPDIRIRLLVGIGGGIPDLENGTDIRLGDVVVSAPSDEHGGVIQYMSGKIFDDGKGGSGPLFKRTGSLNKPPQRLLKVLNAIRAQHESEDSKVSDYLEGALSRSNKLRDRYSFPETVKDRLYSSLPTPGATTTAGPAYAEISRPARSSKDPEIHYGTIASGSVTIQHAGVRDALRDQYNAICVEMEAAGLMNDFECLVIRGISDYADAFKNDNWKRYAAATSAAYAKELLYYLSQQSSATNQDQASIKSMSPPQLPSSPKPNAQFQHTRLPSRASTRTESSTTDDNNTTLHWTPTSPKPSPQPSIAELYDRGNASLNPPDNRLSAGKLYRARKDFLTILGRLEMSVTPVNPKEFVHVYNKLTLTSLKRSYLDIPNSERLSHVHDAERYSALALENAVLSGYQPRTVQTRFHAARVAARRVAMVSASMEEVEGALNSIQDALAAVKGVDPARSRAYDEMAAEDITRLRAQMRGILED